jgi:hypothetical protein
MDRLFRDGRCLPTQQQRNVICSIGSNREARKLDKYLFFGAFAQVLNRLEFREKTFYGVLTEQGSPSAAENQKCIHPYAAASFWVYGI